MQNKWLLNGLLFDFYVLWFWTWKCITYLPVGGVILSGMPMVTVSNGVFSACKTRLFVS